MMDVSVLKRQFTIHDYRQMYTAGILAEDDRVELLDGEIYQNRWVHQDSVSSTTLPLIQVRVNDVFR